MTGKVDVFEAEDLVRLLYDDPELLAFADAIAETGQMRRARRIPLSAPRFLAIGVAVAACLTLALTLPFGGSGPSFVSRALAAVGDGPVLHAVIESSQPVAAPLIDDSTGQYVSRDQSVETEIWYDADGGRGHTITQVDGRVATDEVDTAEGAWNLDGVVHTCAWIAAHPVEATANRESCHFNMDNGTTPKQIPEAPPTVDPALAVFLTGYKTALASGKAHQVGEGVIDGTPIYWIQLDPVAARKIPGSELPPGFAAPGPIVDRVAVDKSSFRPVYVESTQDGRVSNFHVKSIETVSDQQANFARPALRAPSDEVVITGIRDPQDVSLSQVASVLGKAPLWLGQSYNGLPLEATRTVTLYTGYAKATGLEPRSVQGVEFVYGPMENGHATTGSVTIDEAATPEPALGIDSRFGATLAPEGYLRRFGLGYVGTKANVFFTIRLFSGADPSSPDGAAAVARALAPLEAGH